MYEPVRVFGTGRWLRDQEGKWILKKFKVESFNILATDDLKDAIDQMREIQSSEWKAMDDPIGALRALREKGNGLH
jgi:hypothetical protein